MIPQSIQPLGHGGHVQQLLPTQLQRSSLRERGQGRDIDQRRPVSGLALGTHLVGQGPPELDGVKRAIGASSPQASGRGPVAAAGGDLFQDPRPFQQRQRPAGLTATLQAGLTVGRSHAFQQGVHDSACAAGIMPGTRDRRGDSRYERHSRRSPRRRRRPPPSRGDAGSPARGASGRRPDVAAHRKASARSGRRCW
jgi:hypothetical protein